MFVFLWVRASFPRYRYDQIMRLGWKVFIPITLVWLIVVAIWMQTPLNIWKRDAQPAAKPVATLDVHAVPAGEA